MTVAKELAILLTGRDQSGATTLKKANAELAALRKQGKLTTEDLKKVLAGYEDRGTPAFRKARTELEALEKQGKITAAEMQRTLATLQGGPAAAEAAQAGRMAGLMKLGAGAAAGFAGYEGLSRAKEFIVDATGAASDLNETVNKSQVVFGESSKRVEAFGDTAAGAIGQSKQQAVEAAASFGNLFESAGLLKNEAAGLSVNVVKLASDLASFNNRDPSEMLEKLRSGLVGESEPLREVGIMLTEEMVKAKALEMGLGTLSGELSEGAKVQARYQLIVEQSRNALGDFGRTSDQLANSQRIVSASLVDLQTELGQKTLPAAKEASNVFAQVLPHALGKTDDALQIAGGLLAALPFGQAAAGMQQFQTEAEAAREKQDGLNQILADSNFGGIQLKTLGDIAKGWRDLESNVDDVAEKMGFYVDRSSSKIGQAMHEAAVETTRSWRQAERDFSASMESMERAAAAASLAMTTDMEKKRDEMFRLGIGVMPIDWSIALPTLTGLAQQNPKMTQLPDQMADTADRVKEVADAEKDATAQARRFAETSSAVKDSWTDAIAAAKDQTRLFEDEVGRLKQGLEAVWQTPVKGTSFYDKKQQAIQAQIDRAELKLTNLQLEGGSPREIAEQQKLIDRLNLQLRQVQGQEKVFLGPERQKIEEARNPARPEATAAEIIASGKYAQGAISNSEAKAAAAAANAKAVEDASKLAGYASGGSFMVGGSGGVDSQIVAFRATPREVVSVTPPGRAAGGRGLSIENFLPNLNISNELDVQRVLRLIRSELDRYEALQESDLVQAIGQGVA